MKKTFTLTVYSKPMEFSKDEFNFMSDVWRKDYQWEDFIEPLANSTEYTANREYIIDSIQNFIDIYEKGYRACMGYPSANSEIIKENGSNI